jgi:hypothetical protein
MTMHKAARHRTALALGALILMGACAGRPPAPVAVVQATDDSMTCDAIRAEVNANNQRIADLGAESGAKVAQNIAAGVAGAIFILPLFLMDFQGSAGIDERALRSRNDYLAALARTRCTAVQTAQQQQLPQGS